MSTAVVALADNEAFEELVERANIKDAEEVDIANLRRYLKEHPECWGKVMTIAEAAKENALRSLSTSAVAELTRTGIKHIKVQLGYDDSPMLERLMIDHIMLAWINYHYVQFVYDTTVVRTPSSITQVMYWEKRLAISQRRYLRSIETLARVRRMRLPALQVNISEKQINISG